MTLLHSCARATSFPALTEVLRSRAAQVTNWMDLVAEAESQGLAPLVYHHLGAFADLCPAEAKRSLYLLYLRHRHKNGILSQVLADALALLNTAGIRVLVLKGAALCRTVYADIGQRPMRDVDLLVGREQAAQAQDILIGLGFVESSAPRPLDHFHLPSLHKNVEGIAVCIELHTDLFPRCPPYYRHVEFDELAGRAFSMEIGGQQSASLGHTDMLWHLFEHGLHMPLTYEPFKLIAVADIISLVERKYEEIEWKRLARENPHILRALPQLHFISPWQDHVRELVGFRSGAMPKAVGKSFTGWPHLRLSQQGHRALTAILKETFLPPEWWVKTYYGCTSKWAYARSILKDHPRSIWWWMRLYASFLVVEKGGRGGQEVSLRQNFLGFYCRAIKLLITKLQKQK